MNSDADIISMDLIATGTVSFHSPLKTWPKLPAPIRSSIEIFVKKSSFENSFWRKELVFACSNAIEGVGRNHHDQEQMVLFYLQKRYFFGLKIP